MSEKPRSPSAKAPAKNAASTKGGSTTAPAKPRPAESPDEALDILAPPQARDEIGRLAHYRVLKVLGRGGMGTVFLAEDPRLKRQIALKVMLPEMAKKKVACDRFKREAQATAKIEHDHIVTIFDVNEDRGIPYLAMQVLKGMTLDDWLKAGKALNIPQILRIGREVAKGLAAAHACQLIHRDIKPSNIWLDATNKGRVKILDFGLARPTNVDTQLTQEGMILGTPAYMSPEQARGHAVDERSDLFSLGCVLYRLCTGKLPFTGKDPMAMLLAIISDEPTLVAELNPEVPRGLAALVHQMLAKKPEDRPASAREVVHAIQNIERDWLANARTVMSGSLKAPAPPVTSEPVLEESMITEQELQPSQTAEKAGPPPRRNWVLAALGGAAAAVASLMCCFCLAFTSDQGTVIVIAQDGAAKTHLLETGLAVVDHNKQTHKLKEGAQPMRAGGYAVETTGMPRGMQIEPNHFMLSRGQTVEVVMRYVAPSAARPAIERVKTANARKLQEDWARYLGVEMEAPNSIGMKQILIPPGDFEMGSPKELLPGERKFEKVLVAYLPTDYATLARTELPAHPVRITRPFYLGAFEVTMDQFAQFVAATHYVSEAEKTGQGGTRVEAARTTTRHKDHLWHKPAVAQPREHPVSNVTWKDAAAFCDWLSKKEKKVYRLPTEAEWEYACRAGSTSAWHFGDDVQSARNYMWHFFPGAGKIANGGLSQPVGWKKANEFGLFDMHGNVEEMCSDSWSFDYYKVSPPEDPRGPMPDPGKGKVARGGSFLETPLACRSAYRNRRDPAEAHIQLGFRVVCEIAEK